MRDIYYALYKFYTFHLRRRGERERQTFKNTKLKCVVNVFKNALIILRGEKSINNINE